MKIIDMNDVEKTGLPLYEMQTIFSSETGCKDFTISLVTLIPGQRVPETGTGSHDGDEYSVFIEGEVYTESGNDKATLKKGQASLIPKGEAHWCENRTEKPCRLVCFMAK